MLALVPEAERNSVNRYQVTSSSNDTNLLNSPNDGTNHDAQLWADHRSDDGDAQVASVIAFTQYSKLGYEESHYREE